MQAWWSETTGAWIGAIGGGGFGLVVGIYGTLAGWLAPKGIGRRWILSVHAALIVLSALAGVVGIVAVSIGQPYRVWYPLVLCGFVGLFVTLPLYFVIRTRYTQAEMRKLDAGEFRS